MGRKNVVHVRLLNGVHGIYMLSIVSIAGKRTRSWVNFKIPFIFASSTHFLPIYSSHFERRTLLCTMAAAVSSRLSFFFFFRMLSHQTHSIVICMAFLFGPSLLFSSLPFFFSSSAISIVFLFRRSRSACAHFVHIIKLELKWWNCIYLCGKARASAKFAATSPTIFDMRGQFFDRNQCWKANTPNVVRWRCTTCRIASNTNTQRSPSHTLTHIFLI